VEHMNSDALKKRRNVPEGPEPEREVKGMQDALVFVVHRSSSCLWIPLSFARSKQHHVARILR